MYHQYLLSLKIRTANAIFLIYLGSFLFFKIETWNFQYLFEMEFRETSQNFNSFRQLWFSFFLSVVWLSWKFVWKFFFKKFLKVSPFYLEKQVLFLKENLNHCQYQNKKALFTNPIFSQGFGSNRVAGTISAACSGSKIDDLGP